MENQEGKQSFNSHYSKGKSGQYKRYFKGTRTKGKRQKKVHVIDFSNSKGDPVVFKKGGKILLGWVGDEVCKGEFIVSSSKPVEESPGGSQGVTDAVNADDQPVLLKDLRKELARGEHVLFYWDSAPGEFSELKPAVYMCEEGEGHVWIKPKEVHALRADRDEIVSCPYEVDLDKLHVDGGDVGQGDVNVVQMVVEQYAKAVRETQQIFEQTKVKLLKTHAEKHNLGKQMNILSSLYKNALTTTTELRSALFDSTANKDQYSVRIRTLLQLLAEQKDKLNSYERSILSKNVHLQTFRLRIQAADDEKQELLKALSLEQEKWNRTEEERRQLDKKVKELQSQNERLETQNRTLEAKQLLHLEQRPSTSAGHPIIQARPAGAKTKPYTLVGMVLPQTASSLANPKALDARAKEIMKLTEILSSRTNPNREDLVATLASFFRKYPSLATEACNKANITLSKELTAGETLDMKLLLRLPMRKFRQLRRFFSNHGVKIFSSDRQVYKEVTGRRDISDKVVEYGIVELKKTISATEAQQVPFVRVKNLVTHIEDLISSQIEQGRIWDDDKFHGEMWVKILGDKGGSSTKLAVQVCNFEDPNSPDNTDIISMYEATDSYENMDQVFSFYRDQILSLQRNSQIRVGSESKICRVFLVGDYEFLTKVLGHMGASSSYPCLWCYVPLQALAPNGRIHCAKVKDDDDFVDNPDWYSNREPDEFVQDLANNKADPRRGGSTKANGPYHHSISYDPILPIIHGTVHIIPPILHIMLGLVVRFYRNIENLCKEKDQGNLSESDEELYNKWQEVSVEAEEWEREHSSALKDLRFEEKLLEGFKKVQGGKKGRGGNEPCEFPACAVSVTNFGKEEIQWVQCDTCGDEDGDSGWFHQDCVGIKNSVLGDNFECPVCLGQVSTVRDVLERQKLIVENQQKTVTDLKSNRDKSKGELEKIHKQVNSKMGPLEKELGRILEDELGVKKQAYHSQCFVGNHCKKILDNSDLLMKVLDGLEKQPLYRELFSKLRDIFRLALRSRFLTYKEVDELCVKCWELGTWFPKSFPEERVPPKLHFLLCHIPECAKMWSTVGLLSEHGIESLHAQVNADERVYASVRDNQTRLKLMFAQHGRRMQADKSKLKTVARKCSEENCPGRYKTIGRVRKCQVCHKEAK